MSRTWHSGGRDVVIILLKGALLHDDPQMLLQFLGLTAYLIVPVAIIFAALMLDEAWD